MKNPYTPGTMKAIGWDDGYEAGAAEQFESSLKEEPASPDPNLIAFYLQKGYDICPSCGRGKEEFALTGCPKGSHYGTCC